MVLLTKDSKKCFRGSVTHSSELQRRPYFNPCRKTYHNLEAEELLETHADYYLKVVLLGDTGVGKTRLFKDFSFIYKKVKSERLITEHEKINVGCVNRLLNVRNESVLLRLYDTAGMHYMIQFDIN